MAGFFNSFKNLLVYKEPEDKKAFELLEDEYEGNKQITDNQINWDKIGIALKENKIDKCIHEKKAPLKVDEWNEMKNNEHKNGETIDRIKNNLVSENLSVNIEYLKQRFNIPRNEDIIIHEFYISHEIKACIVFLDGMVDKTILNHLILPQLMNAECFRELDKKCPLDYIMKSVLSINKMSKFDNWNTVILQILSGSTALLIDGCEETLSIDSKGYEKRSVEKPHTESVVRGPQEGFTENLPTNLTLIRRNIRNERLITETLTVGKTDNTKCAIVYLEGVANSKVVKEVKRRLKNIEYDFVLGDGMIEQLIEDSPYMLLPQVVSTERPDRACSFIMEGQVVILGEGAPFAIAVPITLFHLLHTSEDAMLRWQYGTFLRFVRLLGVLLAAFLPGLYIALTLFHHEMIPTPLLTSIVNTRENVPFPAIIEILMMEVSFELIREGGIRIPGVIGQTLGIIGALILGQAAVSAGLVSSILIIVVAVAGLGSFAIPSYSLSLAVRIMRFLFTFLGALLGFFGISVGFVILGALMCNMTSFGVPFLSPAAPKTNGSNDLLIRHPIFRQKMRPDFVNTPDRRRAKDKVRAWDTQQEGSGK